MMETKLCISLCVLLLLSLGSAKHDEVHAAAVSPTNTASRVEVYATIPVTVPVLEHISHSEDTPAPNGPDTNSSSKSSTTFRWENTSVTSQPSEDNETNLVSATPDSYSEINGTLPKELTPQPPYESPSTTSHTTTTIRSTGSTHTAHSVSIETPTTNSHHSAVLPPNSNTTSTQPSITKTQSHTSLTTLAPASASPEMKPQPTAFIQSTQFSSALCTGCSQETPNSLATTHESSQSTSIQPGTHLETSSKAHPKTTVTQPSSPSTPTKAHADTPSQLNVKGDTTMVHESPTLDPLLAGLVSAFIITAVIITLLLFLKLRRRNNRPEFRRLQDLPMDDMMEDTPLSMYNY